MNLTLHLKKKWWDQIHSGKKKAEYRLATPYWKKRLEGRDYEHIILKLGYPKEDNDSRSMIFAWNGASLTNVISSEWNYESKRVYEIPLSVVPMKGTK